jgi:hypothetical protein
MSRQPVYPTLIDERAPSCRRVAYSVRYESSYFRSINTDQLGRSPRCESYVPCCICTYYIGWHHGEYPDEDDNHPWRTCQGPRAIRPLLTLLTPVHVALMSVCARARLNATLTFMIWLPHCSLTPVFAGIIFIGTITTCTPCLKPEADHQRSAIISSRSILNCAQKGPRRGVRR